LSFNPYSDKVRDRRKRQAMAERVCLLMGACQMCDLFFLPVLTTIASFQALIRLVFAAQYHDDGNRNDS
jgi:hypothetical protein